LTEPRKIKVQFVIATLDVGGAERQLTALATRLDPQRFEVDVLCLTRGGRFEEPLKEAGIQYTILNKKPGLDVFCLPNTWRHIRRFQPDIVHGWLFTGGAFGRAAAILNRTPVRIVSERSVSHWRTGLYQLSDTLLARKTQVILCNSSAVADWVKPYARLRGQRVEVIANGVEAQSFPVRDLPLEVERPVLMTVCRMTQAKRLDHLLDAVHILHQEGLSFRLDLVGDGELRGVVEQQIETLNLQSCVRCLGSQTDVISCLKTADVFVLTSDREGLPNAVMEAMAMGLPVVATRAGGTPDLVKPETGILVDCGDVVGIANGLRTLILEGRTRRQMGAAGRQRIEEHFSMEAMVAKHEALYKQTLQRPV